MILRKKKVKAKIFNKLQSCVRNVMCITRSERAQKIKEMYKEIVKLYKRAVHYEFHELIMTGGERERRPQTYNFAGVFVKRGEHTDPLRYSRKPIFVPTT